MKSPQIISSPLPDLNSLPYPDYTSFYGYKRIQAYPLITSRGCPYNCSFCAVHLISSRMWRPRKPDNCINELKKAKETLPNLKAVVIQDDNPLVDSNRFEKFLRLFVDANFGWRLELINARADQIDDELVKLLKEAGCRTIGLGIEHGDPEVFRQIDKKESLEDIRRASEIVKRHGLKLNGCFIIGLPGDSFSKTYASINFAKQLSLDYVYWNMATPYRGTRIRSWYKQVGGQLFNEIGHSSYTAPSSCEEPLCESPDFTREERRKAYLAAILETNTTTPFTFYEFMPLLRLVPLAIKYNCQIKWFYWFLQRMKTTALTMYSWLIPSLSRYFQISRE